MNPTEATITPPAAVVAWLGDAIDGYLTLLDQTQLPLETIYMDCRTAQEIWDAIQRLVVRGAPAIGVAAGYGLVVACQPHLGDDDFLAAVAQQAEYLNSSRPTAVNLAWATNRVLTRARQAEGDNLTILTAMLDEAKAIHEEDTAMCRAIGDHAAELIRQHRGVLTHCNAGALATAGIGTATAGMYVAHATGHAFTVYCDETRPLLQGSRLTAWELQQAGIDAVVITDNMSAQVMKEGKVGMAIVGADRIAANGDAANKIGTYGVAILAKYHNIPLYVAAPYSTFDLSLTSGDDIPIELRGSEEITCGYGKQTAPTDIRTYSPAFDVTPVDLITGIITERGIISPVTPEAIQQMIEK